VRRANEMTDEVVLAKASTAFPVTRWVVPMASPAQARSWISIGANCGSQRTREFNAVTGGGETTQGNRLRRQRAGFRKPLFNLARVPDYPPAALLARRRIVSVSSSNCLLCACSARYFPDNSRVASSASSPLRS
jgi:hypothetical protein